MLSKRELAAEQADFLFSQIKNDKNLLHLAQIFAQASGVNPLDDPAGWESAQPVGEGAKTFGRARMMFVRAAASNPFWNHYRNAKILLKLLSEDSSPRTRSAPPDDPDIVSGTGPEPVVYGQYVLNRQESRLERHDRVNDPDHLVILVRLPEAPKKNDSEYDDYVSDDPSFAPPVSIAIQADDDEPDWAAEEKARLEREAAEREAESAESSLVTNDSVKTYFTRLDEVKEREEATNIIYVDGKGYRKSEYERMMAEKGEDVRKKDSHDFGPSIEEEDLKEKMESIRSQNKAELERLKQQDADSLLDAMFAQKMAAAPESLSDNPDDEPSLWDMPRSEESLRETPAPDGKLPKIEHHEKMEVNDLSDNPDDEPGLLDTCPEKPASPEPSATGASPKRDYVFGVPEGYIENEDEQPDTEKPAAKRDYVFGVPEGYAENEDEQPDMEKPAAKRDYVFGVPEGYREEGGQSAPGSEPEPETARRHRPAFGPDADNNPEKPRDAGKQRIVLGEPLFGNQEQATPPFDEDTLVPEDDFDENAIVSEDDFDEPSQVPPVSERQDFSMRTPAPEDFPAGDKNASPVPESGDDPFGDEPEPVPASGDDPFGDEPELVPPSIPESGDDPFGDEPEPVPESGDDPFGDEPEPVPESDDDPFAVEEPPSVPESDDDPFDSNQEPDSGQKPDILAETMRKSPIQAEQPKSGPEPVKNGNGPENPVSVPKRSSFIKVVNRIETQEPVKTGGAPNPLQSRFGKPVVKVVKKSEWEN